MGKGLKNSCKNYLFEDYCLKSGVAISDPSLRTSGETVEKVSKAKSDVL
jgi:hypothetical protein